MADGQVVFEITADGKHAIASVQEVTRAIQTESKKWDTEAGNATKSMQNQFSSMLTKVGAAFSAAKLGQALFDFGKQAIDAASDLREVQNVVDVTFGESASQIEAWAKTASQQFGLTETKAKQFTSTLGAMMKSSGLAGDEIVSMSTDLAGLAADMSSFYNLDFDTAFQKIRAGISGETEPLKQLGINMSVANLEAYAMTQGITKAFDKMSQGEQVMLRYQYLMSATADAQGDFARTADGYANAQRRIQASIETIKTTVGSMLMNVVEPLTSGFAEFLSNLTAVPERTVLDEFADIDANTERKMAEVTKTANDARALIEILKSIESEKVENTSLTGFVTSLTTQLGDLDTAMSAAKDGNYAGTIKGIADALELKTGVSSDKWTTLLTAISANLPAATDAADSDDQKTAKWLTAAGDAAAELGGEYPGLWKEFLDTLGSTTTETALSYMASGQAAADALGSIGLNADSLDGSENNKWSTFLATLTTADPTKGLFGDTAQTAASNIKTLADALSGNDPAKRQSAWASMLGTLSANAEGVAQLTGDSVEGTKKWLEDLAAAANTLDANDTEGWKTLFDALKEGFKDVKLEGTNAEIFAQLAQGFAQLGTESTKAEKALKALGIDTSGVEDAQELWLRTCKELVKTIPGLSDIIDTHTGEIKGGVDALITFVDEYEDANKKMIALQALQAKEEALQRKRIDAQEYYFQAEKAKKAKKLWEDTKSWQATGVAPSAEEQEYYETLLDNVTTTTEAYDRQMEALQEAEDEMEIYRQIVSEMPGDLSKLEGGLEGAGKGAEDLALSMKDAAEGIKGVKSAFEDIEKYYDNVYNGIERALEGTHSLFGSIETPMDKLNNQLTELRAEKDALLANKKDTETIEIKISGAEKAIQTFENMSGALEQQASWYKKYNEMLEQARAKGYSEEILSALADGTAESFDSLKELTSEAVSEASVQKFNENFANAARQREELTKALADQTTKTDQAFQSLVESATSAIADLNLGDEAKAALEATVQGIADGISAKIPAVQRQINALNAVLAQLNKGAGAGGNSGGFVFGSSNGLITAEPLSKGMDYVPFDNYLAALHEGESVLTAEEAKVWRAFRSSGMGSRNAVDYDALGATMRDNVRAGGNVYLDGQTVGRVISARQADSYRAMERSGFQS